MPPPPYVCAVPQHWLNHVVGDGQCVAFVRTAANVPATAQWRRGSHVKGDATIAQGTAIATFDPDGAYGNHTDGRSHAAIYDGQDDEGLSVYDQWKGQNVHRRLVRFGGATPADDGAAFYVIMT